MISCRSLASSIVFTLLFSGLVAAQDLSRYRDFQFGMSLESVAALTDKKIVDVKTVHQRPDVIQTLEWSPSGYFSSGKSGSIRSIRFDFFNGGLAKMLVTYDPTETDGLTTEDMIEAISAVYGKAVSSESTIAVFKSAAYEDNQKMLATWEDTEHSYNLFRASYGNAFGLIAFSKKLDLLGIASRKEADRLDKLEAPQRELARQAKQEDAKRVAQEKARLVNKLKFRP